MTKEFIPYEQALALKELEFNEPCFANYTVILEDGIDWFIIPEQGITDKTSFGSSKNYNSKSFEEEGTISAPTFSQAFRWFREKNYDVAFRKMDYGNDSVFTGYYYTIYKGMEMIDLHGADKRSKTYEEAELACLIKLIEIVKQK